MLALTNISIFFFNHIDMIIEKNKIETTINFIQFPLLDRTIPIQLFQLHQMIF